MTQQPKPTHNDTLLLLEVAASCRAFARHYINVMGNIELSGLWFERNDGLSRIASWLLALEEDARFQAAIEHAKSEACPSCGLSIVRPVPYVAYP